MADSAAQQQQLVAQPAEQDVDYYTAEMAVRDKELDAVAAEIEAAYAAALSAGSQGMAPRPLAENVVSASLSCLGHNAAGRVVYTTATLNSLSLSSVDVLAKFRFLQKVLLDMNHLTTVAPLSACESLVHLSLSGNQLTEKAFDELRGAADTLQFLDVSRNRLTSLKGAEHLRYLNTLLADGNKITTVRAKGEVSNLKSLWKLSLAENQITSIEQGAFLHCPLRILDLSRNELHDLTNALDLTKTLTVLGVEDNSLMHLSEVVQFAQLSAVNLAGNNLYDMAEVHMLAHLKLLRSLSLIGNPLCSFGAMPAAPIDDDATSDIVCPDDDDEQNADGTPVARRGRHQPSPPRHPTDGSSRPTRAVPSAVHATSLRKPQNAPFQSQPPASVDEAHLSALRVEQRYRLHVVWRVPQLAALDGADVLPAEAADASNLVGGVDREQRLNSEKLLMSRSQPAAHSHQAAGSAVQAARHARSNGSV
jgi:hypothetical protein